MHEKNTVSYALEWSYIDLVYSPQNCFFWPYTPLVNSFYFRKSRLLQLIWFVGKKTTEYDTTFYRLFSSNHFLFPKVKRSIWIEILAITNHTSFTVFRNNKVTSKVNVMCYLHICMSTTRSCAEVWVWWTASSISVAHMLVILSFAFPYPDLRAIFHMSKELDLFLSGQRCFDQTITMLSKNIEPNTIVRSPLPSEISDKCWSTGTN